jgi:hypothetical protein
VYAAILGLCFLILAEDELPEDKHNQLLLYVVSSVINLRRYTCNDLIFPQIL